MAGSRNSVMVNHLLRAFLLILGRAVATLITVLTYQELELAGAGRPAPEVTRL